MWYDMEAVCYDNDMEANMEVMWYDMEAVWCDMEAVWCDMEVVWCDMKAVMSPWCNWCTCLRLQGSDLCVMHIKNIIRCDIDDSLFHMNSYYDHLQ